MSYYEEKKRAINLIDELIEAEKTEDEIYFQISKRYGYGRKLVKERLDLYEKLRGKK